MVMTAIEKEKKTCEVTLKLTQKQYDNLKSWMADGDYCFICDNHPSHGHSEDCPFYETDAETPQV